MPQFVKTQTFDFLRQIVIDRPELHNAFNEVVIEELAHAMVEAGRSDDVRAVVLASEGKSFSAGADINWMKRMVDYSFEENVKDANAMAGMLRAIRECPKPVIARVQGATFGGGVGLVAACDMAVAVESAIFCLSEVKLGIIPAVISPYVTEKIGPGPMRRYGVTAERFDGIEAQRIGLISEVVETIEELDAWIADVVGAIRKNGPAATAACKVVLSEVAGMQWDRVQQITTERIARLRVSPEGQEGLKAFLEKRTASWVGSE